MCRQTEHADVSSDATCKEALPQTGREGLLFFYFSFCSVARWDATFCSFRGIGRGGTAFPRGAFLQGRGPLRDPICEGRCPSALPTRGRSAPPPRVTFVSRRKSPKACQGRCPWTPLGGRLKSVPLFSPIPPATLCVAPPRKGRVPLRVEGFATLTQ